MGLDMYAYTSKIKDLECETNPEKQIKDDATEIAYWRKHNRLHGWFENKWENKNSEVDSSQPFNCVRYYISRSDLDELEFDLKGQLLPATQGFFFGEDSYTNEEEVKEQVAFDLDFVMKARKELEEGKHVYYTSWW
jgi:hypothetical protein